MVELLEREQLLAQLDALRGDGGRLVFVGGEAGVGKTALVRAFEDAAGEVLRGSCENLAAPTPLGPFLDVGVEPGEPRAIATSVLERGGVLVLEDVHWADGASLDVLRVLGRRVDGLGGVHRRHLPRRRGHGRPSAARRPRRARVRAGRRPAARCRGLSLDAVRELADAASGPMPMRSTG